MRLQAPQPTGEGSRTDDRLAPTGGGYSPQVPLYQTPTPMARPCCQMWARFLYYFTLRGMLAWEVRYGVCPS